MSRIPHSRNFRTTGTRNPCARTFDHCNPTGGADNGRWSGQAPDASGIGAAIAVVALLFAIRVAITHPIATLIALIATWAFFNRK